MAFHAFLPIIAVLYCSAIDISIVEQTNTRGSAALKTPNGEHNSAQSGVVISIICIEFYMVIV